MSTNFIEKISFFSNVRNKNRHLAVPVFCCDYPMLTVPSVQMTSFAAIL